ncbi:MAG: hypothetical protein L0Z62_27960, partial [Gemmataceae bacterium]|nr:hypothetical protein [Gemmataceae bacterium]
CEILPQTNSSTYRVPNALAWSATGRLIVSMDHYYIKYYYRKLQIWNAATGKPLWCDKKPDAERLHTHVSAFRFVADDRLLALVRMNHADNTWHVESSKPARGRPPGPWI